MQTQKLKLLLRHVHLFILYLQSIWYRSVSKLDMCNIKENKVSKLEEFTEVRWYNCNMMCSALEELSKITTESIN